MGKYIAFSDLISLITDWGKDKVFKNYLGADNKDLWAKYDSCEVIKGYKGPTRDILVDQGDSDEFLLQILHPDHLITAAAESPNHVKITLRMQPGYNHSYFFVQSFIPDHFAHHAKILNA
jgi:S-formylglutathione hydrolase